MYKILLIVFLGFSFLFLQSCGKKDSTETQTKTQNNQSNTQSQTTASKDSYFKVKNVSEVTKPKESVEFSWIEDGKEVKLSDFKGKVVLVNFWATWCPPCRKELPDLSSIASDLQSKDFKMIGVSVDEDVNKLKSFLQSNSLSYTIVHDMTTLTGKYMEAGGINDNVIPQTYIIDKNGKIVESIIGGKSKADFLQLIKKYL
jgi:peroxiredoxin